MDMGKKMNIVMRKVGDLIPYEHNPRRNDAAVDPVAESIKEFGFRIPIIIDSDNVVVTGHTRLKAAYKLGIEEVPCLVADDLTEDQIKAFRIVDNKVAELSTWNLDRLAEELDAIDMDMVWFGFYEYDPTEVFNTSAEIDMEDFSDDKFEYECKRCGFRFNTYD